MYAQPGVNENRCFQFSVKSDELKFLYFDENFDPKFSLL